MLWSAANNDLFHMADRATVLADRAKPRSDPTASRAAIRTGAQLVQLADPDHRKMRALTQAWVSCQANIEDRGPIREIAPLRNRGPWRTLGRVRLITQVALGYPLRIVMEILGGAAAR